MVNFTPVYVVGYYTPESCGGFDWYWNAFDAGRAYERELQGGNYTAIYHDVVLVPSHFSKDGITYYIDEMLTDLEDKAIERGRLVKGELVSSG